MIVIRWFYSIFATLSFICDINIILAKLSLILTGLNGGVD
jgi:hypothetical protein